MGARYLTDLADVCRRAGLIVVEVDGWRDRARSSGGYDAGRPDHVMVHHTASGPSSDGWPDVNYMCSTGNANYPTANLYLNRAGLIWAMAAGATNTNGKGRCPHCGLTDSMNTRAIGIEAGNDGVGEPWPSAQQRAYVQLVRALCAHYAVNVSAVRAHFEYAPDRKVDPAGPCRWAPHPTGGGGANEWRMDAFRADVTAPPPPEPEPEEEPMPYLLMNHPDYPNDRYGLFPSGQVRWLHVGEWNWLTKHGAPVAAMYDANEINALREAAGVTREQVAAG